MPSNALVIALVVWIVLIFQFVRAVRNGRLKDRASWKLWAIFFCGSLAFTLRGESGDLEVTLPPYTFLIGGYAKYFGLLGAFHLYFQVLKDILPKKFAHRNWLDYLWTSELDFKQYSRGVLGQPIEGKQG